MLCTQLGLQQYSEKRISSAPGVAAGALLHLLHSTRLMLQLSRTLAYYVQRGSYCLGVFDNGRQGTLLGGITFRNVLVQVRCSVLVGIVLYLARPAPVAFVKAAELLGLGGKVRHCCNFDRVTCLAAAATWNAMYPPQSECPCSTTAATHVWGSRGQHAAASARQPEPPPATSALAPRRCLTAPGMCASASVQPANHEGCQMWVTKRGLQCSQFRCQCHNTRQD